MRKTILITLLAAINLVNMNAQYNVVKLGMSELLSLKTSLQYERILNERTSAHLTLNLRPSLGLPSFLYENVLDVTTDPVFKTSNFAIFPEFRFYTGFNIAPEGFYIGVQGKYSKTNIDLGGLILDESDSDFAGSIKNAGAGLQLGHQWLINEKMTVDFYFIGITLQKTTFSGTITSDDPNADFESMETSLEDGVEGVPFLHKLEVTSNDNNLKTELSSLTLGFRTGVSIGFAF